jgi:PKHD-type hydroxylase
MNMWGAFHYCEVFAGRFNAEECECIIAQHQETGALRSRMPRSDSGFIRDSDLFWVPRTKDTDWIFERIWDVATLYNSRYGFGLSEEMGQLQLTRYAAGQLYDWHMDLGGGAMSLRKITIVVELAVGTYQGGGTEVFHGEGTSNLVALGQGDALIFPSFIMHRAVPVRSGARWTLVSWLTGPKPLN